MSKPDIAIITATVQRYLDGIHLGDIFFVVDSARIVTGDNWVRVPVRPSRLPAKLFQYYEILAELQEDIVAKEGFDLLLMAGEPLEDAPQLLAKAA